MLHIHNPTLLYSDLEDKGGGFGPHGNGGFDENLDLFAFGNRMGKALQGRALLRRELGGPLLGFGSLFHEGIAWRWFHFCFFLFLFLFLILHTTGIFTLDELMDEKVFDRPRCTLRGLVGRLSWQDMGWRWGWSRPQPEAVGLGPEAFSTGIFLLPK